MRKRGMAGRQGSVLVGERKSPTKKRDPDRRNPESQTDKAMIEALQSGDLVATSSVHPGTGIMPSEQAESNRARAKRTRDLAQIALMGLITGGGAAATQTGTGGMAMVDKAMYGLGGGVAGAVGSGFTGARDTWSDADDWLYKFLQRFESEIGRQDRVTREAAGGGTRPPQYPQYLHRDPGQGVRQSPGGRFGFTSLTGPYTHTGPRLRD